MDELQAAHQFQIPFQNISSSADLYLVPGKLHPKLAMSVPAECMLQPPSSTLTEEEKLQVIHSEQEVLKKCQGQLREWYRDRKTRKFPIVVDIRAWLKSMKAHQ